VKGKKRRGIVCGEGMPSVVASLKRGTPLGGTSRVSRCLAISRSVKVTEHRRRGSGYHGPARRSGGRMNGGGVNATGEKTYVNKALWKRGHRQGTYHGGEKEN